MAEPIIRSEFDIPLLASLPEDIRERLSTVQEKSGFLPNIFVALARHAHKSR